MHDKIPHSPMINRHNSYLTILPCFSNTAEACAPSSQATPEAAAKYVDSCDGPFGGFGNSGDGKIGRWDGKMGWL